MGGALLGAGLGLRTGGGLGNRLQALRPQVYGRPPVLLEALHQGPERRGQDLRLSHGPDPLRRQVRKPAEKREALRQLRQPLRGRGRVRERDVPRRSPLP
jgi:hypothetical protein